MRWLPAALLLLVVAGAADVVSAVFRMIIVQQCTPDALQGRVNSLVFAGLQGGPRLGDAESGGVAELAGPQFAAWSGGLLSVATAVVTCWAIPQFWRYRATTVAGGQSSRPDAGSGQQAGGWVSWPGRGRRRGRIGAWPGQLSPGAPVRSRRRWRAPGPGWWCCRAPCRRAP